MHNGSRTTALRVFATAMCAFFTLLILVPLASRLPFETAFAGLLVTSAVLLVVFWLVAALASVREIGAAMLVSFRSSGNRGASFADWAARNTEGDADNGSLVPEGAEPTRAQKIVGVVTVVSCFVGFCSVVTLLLVQIIVWLVGPALGVG